MSDGDIKERAYRLATAIKAHIELYGRRPEAAFVGYETYLYIVGLAKRLRGDIEVSKIIPTLMGVKVYMGQMKAYKYVLVDDIEMLDDDLIDSADMMLRYTKVEVIGEFRKELKK